MYSRLRCYLYAFLLMIISSSSFAVTPKEQAMGGFPFPVVCSHPSNLDYCADATQSEAEKKACGLGLATLNSTYGYAFTSVVSNSNGTKSCLFTGKNPSSGRTETITLALTYKTGLCPVKGLPPPEQVVFSRNGRWFPQELENKRCYRSCLYTNGQSFNYKQYAFTNGVLTNFTEKMDARLTSEQQFCEPVPEPSRNDEGETTYDANCDDAFLTVFCEFVEWYRSDAEMPETPEVQQKSLDLSYLKTDRVNIEDNANNLCFEPIEFNLFLPWSRDEVKQEITFYAMCSKIEQMGNIFRALYLIGACFIIFGGRK